MPINRAQPNRGGLSAISSCNRSVFACAFARSISRHVGVAPRAISALALEFETQRRARLDLLPGSTNAGLLSPMASRRLEQLRMSIREYL